MFNTIYIYHPPAVHFKARCRRDLCDGMIESNVLLQIKMIRIFVQVFMVLMNRYKLQERHNILIVVHLRELIVK